MSQTIIPWGDPKAQKAWSSTLAVDVNRQSYFTQRFIGKGPNNIIEQKTELQSDTGDRVSFDLSVQLKQAPTRGDEKVEGKEETLRFFSDEVIIDQIRHPVSAGGKMTRKRTAHDLRKTARDRLSEYWKDYLDELMFMYLAGARGINEDFKEDTDFTGHAGNALQPPDAGHHMFGGAAQAANEITAADVFNREIIERAVTKSRMIRALDPNSTNMAPVTVKGEKRFVTVMSPFQEHDLRMEVGSTGWAEIQRDAGRAGGNNKLFAGGLGMINNVILHSHEAVVRFSNYGAGANLPASRALFMGRQAAVVAYGTPGGQRFMWKEESKDYGNEPTVVAGCIVGMKKTVFNGSAFGVMAIDTHAKNPEDA